MGKKKGAKAAAPEEAERQGLLAADEEAELAEHAAAAQTAVHEIDALTRSSLTVLCRIETSVFIA